MPNKNLCILVGHAGGDPEVRYSSSGTCIANFSLATSWGKKDSDGNWENFTDWHKVVAFGKLGEKVAEYLNKGQPVMVEGSIRYESWEDDQGNKKYATKIIARSVDVLVKPVDNQNQEKVDNQVDNKNTEEEDDLPF